MNQDNNARKQGFRQFAIGMVLYGVIVVASGFLVDPQTIPAPYAVVLALLPMAAAVWGMVGWLRALRTFDELQQKMFADAGLISLGLTAVATLTYGFLEAMVNLPPLSMFAVVPFIGFTYALALPFAHRRYS